MKKALIITGGYINFEKIDLNSQGFNYIIAADSGYLAAERLDIKPEYIVGDFDSSPLPNTNAEIIKVPAEKDDTDTMLACNLAIELGATYLTIVGGTGGRADHFLSNVFSLEAFKENNVAAIMTDGDNTIRVIEDETVKIPNKNTYFSIFSLSPCKVTLTGCKYPLNNFSLPRENPSFAVSNEVTDDYAMISVIGRAILCECSK